MKPRYIVTPNRFGRFLCAIGVHAKRRQTFMYDAGTILMDDGTFNNRIGWWWYRCARCRRIV